MIKKVLIIEGRRTIGGGQVMSRKVACALKDSCDVTIFIPNGETPISDYMSIFRQCKFSFIEYSRGRKSMKDIFRFARNFIVSAIHLRRCIKESGIDTIYVQSPSMLPVAALVGNWTKRKVIAHLHVVHSDGKSRKLLNFFLDYRSVRQIVGVSNYTLSQLTPKNRKKSTVIYNCIDIDTPLISKEFKEPYRFAVIGDILPDKGQLIAADAISALSDDSYLKLVGSVVDNSYADSIKECLPNTEFMGQVVDVAAQIDTVDIVIVSSTALFETFSLSMVEAWSRGVPTLASNYGGMKELVEEFLPEFADTMLFERGDSEDLRAKIERLVNDKELYASISIAVVEVVNREFSFAKFSQQINQIIK